MAEVSIVVGKGKVDYPGEEDFFSPDTNFPEYQWKNEISEKENKVYSLVRELFHIAGYDNDHYGMQNWNPLGEFIKPGQKVVLKPNWVNDINKKGANKTDIYGMNCLVTHPSVIRAVCDYCLIALNGQGEITICDAPVQDCNFDLLKKRAGIEIIQTFYRKCSQKVYFKDLRREVRVANRFEVKKKTLFQEQNQLYIQMDENTAFKSLKGEYEFSVSNYDKDITNEFHKKEQHIYAISKKILDADIIINICKPKCHRFAGITAAMKNCIGMVTEKETLPHRRYGDVSTGGDSYSKKSYIKKKIDDVLDRQIKLEDKNKIVRATICRFEYGLLYYMRKIAREDASLKGGWHGNDTIWRTIHDLNYLIRFADKSGYICKKPQRSIINIGDMIIAGQHNGPLSPEQKRLGILLCSKDAYAFDRVVCEIMGFGAWKIPTLKNIMNGNSWMKCEQINLKSNYKSMNGIIDNITFPTKWKFIPHDSWKNFLENKDL